MNEVIQQLLGVTLVMFMVGNLLEMGLKLRLKDAFGALRNGRFVILSLLWAFVLCPGLAIFLAKVVPMPEPYALGLLFIGLAPCAPFLPMVSQKAGGDLAYAGAFMLLTAVGTVILMPLLVPVLAKGFKADVWVVAKPLVCFIAIPLVIGIAIRGAAEGLAEKAHPLVKKVTGIATLIMLICCFAAYGKDFLSAIGTYAIGAQVLFYVVVVVASSGLGFGMPPAQKSVLVLGVCTRNVGAAVAPLMAVADTDRRAIAMCVLAVPLSVISSLITAARFARRSR